VTPPLPRAAVRAAAAALLLGCLGSPGSAFAGWQLAWSDEFSGTSVDSSKWSFDTGNGQGGWGNGELEYYTTRATNVYVSNGVLHIVARKESYSGFSYTSAKMKTLGHFSPLYGRFEFRVKLPQGTGYWPALWLMPSNSVYGGWAASGEVDIMENKGRIPTQVMGTLHYGASYPNNVHTGLAYDLPNGGSVTSWHVYAMEWTTNQFSWYVDGVLYQTQNSWYTVGHDFPAPFNIPFYIIMNLAVGGQFDGPPTGSTAFPGDMQVDYVRYYNWFTPAAPVLALRVPFTDARGTTTSPSDASGGGFNVTMQMTDGTGVPADAHGAAGSGVRGESNGSRALDFTSNGTNQPGIPGPLAATTNAALGFGTVSNFMVSLWFKQNALMPTGANVGPRLFVLGGGTPSDAAETNSIGLKFQTAGQLYFQLGASMVPFNINLQTNNWVFVAAVYDGASVSIYQGTDGAISTLTTNVMVSTNVSFGSSGALYIGNRQDGQRSFDGLINDFRFYTGAGDGTFVENIRLLAARPPWGLTATGGDGQVSLSWGTALGATRYNVKRSAISGGPYANLAAGLGVTNTDFIDLTAVNGATNYYVVSTVNSAGEGAVSGEAGATASCTTTPAATNDGPVCAGSTLNLTATPISGAAYAWTGPNGFTSSDQNPSIAHVTGAASGVYQVTVTVGGCTSSPATTTATVTSTPAPTAGNNGPLCAGSTLALTASTVAGASYSWTGPNGFASTAQNPSITNATPAASGTYSVTATVGGCASVAATNDVVVNAIPTAPTAGNNGPLCAGSTLNLTASTVPGAVYSWAGPNSFSSADQNPTIANATTNAAGVYSVAVTVGACSSAAGTTAVTVIPPVSSLSIQSVSNGLKLIWQSGTLQSATNLAGPWEDMTGAEPTSCIVAPDDQLHFFRLK
jgi:beta-glucanase (GH16 family)